MSLREQQDVLVKLYTDPVFREAFYSHPEDIGRDFRLTADEIAEISVAARDGVKQFSESLVWKRLREVEKMLPKTRHLLSDDFEPAFLAFAPSYNPQGIKKHYEDAVEFCRFLTEDRSFSESARNAASFESTRLTFINENKKLAVCRQRPGVMSFAVWMRIGRRVFHFTI